MAQSPLFINWLTNQPIPITPGTLVPPVRTALTGSLTVYVNNSTGNDSNNGLTPTTAFATLQAAYNSISANYDFNQQTVTMQYGITTTITDTLSISRAWEGGGVLVIDLSSSTWSVTNNTCLVVSNPLPGELFLQHVTMQTTTSGNCIVVGNAGATLFIGPGVTFGACAGVHMYCTNLAFIFPNSPYTISGAATEHIISTNNASVAYGAAATPITVSGTPAINIFAVAQIGGILDASATTYSGAATGTRYLAQLNGVIWTNGGGATFFPGNAGGSTATGGVYG